MGIDGGGSKTLALLADEYGQVIGRGLAGPSNFQLVGIPAARSALQDALSQAFHSANVPVQRLAALCLGMAGVSRPADRQWLDDWLATSGRKQLSDKVEIVTDGALLLWAGTPQGWGVGVVAGTGSIAMGCSPDGRWARAGGWGHLLGDHGSGYWIAVTGLRAAIRDYDRHGRVGERLGDGSRPRDNAGTLLGKPAGDGQSDAATGTGDDDGLAVQVQVHDGSSDRGWVSVFNAMRLRAPAPAECGLVFANRRSRVQQLHTRRR